MMKHLVIVFISAAVFFTAPANGQDQTIQLLQRIADTPGPSGFEEPIRKVMVEYMKPVLHPAKTGHLN
jgi:hypothetical protein